MAKRSRFVLVIFVIVTAVSLLLGGWYLCNSGGKEFDPIAWSDTSQVMKGMRLGMADQLVAHKILIGKDRAEVVAMLGEPPPTQYFNTWDMVYWLGPERSWISIDSEWLVIRLSKDGRVVDYQIVGD
jgi:hypothetical protein